MRRGRGGLPFPTPYHRMERRRVERRDNFTRILARDRGIYLSTLFRIAERLIDPYRKV